MIRHQTAKNNGDAQQFNGREGETATLLSTGLFNSELRGGGFAPRHLNRSAAILCVRRKKMEQVPNCSFCGRSENEIGGLLRGISNDFICLNCVEQSSSFSVNTDASANCGFCGRNQKEVPKLLSSKSPSICDVCVEIMSCPPSVLTRSGFIVNPTTRFGSWLLNSKNRFIKKYVVGGEE